MNTVEIIPKDYEDIKLRVISLSNELDQLRKEIASKSSLDVNLVEERIRQFTSQNFKATKLEELNADLLKLQNDYALLSSNQIASDNDLEKLSSTIEELSKAIKNLSLRVDENWNAFDNLSKEFVEIKQKLKIPSKDEITKLVIEKMEAILPEKLLVRTNSDNEIIIDSRFFEYLTAHFGKSSEHKQDYEKMNAQAIDNFVTGKLNSLEHKIVGKDQISELVRQQLLNSYKEIDTNLQSNLDVLKSYVNTKIETISESRQNQLDTEKFSLDLLNKAQMMINEKVAYPKTSVIVDYALESMGAKVILPLTSRSYQIAPPMWSWAKYLSIGGSFSKPPRVALSHDNSLGNCWAFGGNDGSFAVSLAQPVSPTHFTIEHLAKEIQVDKTSAPRSLEVHAIPDISNPSETILVGSYHFKLDSDSYSQTFPASFRLQEPCRYYQLRIHSNHGHPEYTCLYHFGIHSM